MPVFPVIAGNNCRYSPFFQIEISMFITTKKDDFNFRQECIPVGCVPADRRPYARVCFRGGGSPSGGDGGVLHLGGFSIWGGFSIRGGSPSGGVLLWGGSAPGGFSMPGGSGKENPSPL